MKSPKFLDHEPYVYTYAQRQVAKMKDPSITSLCITYHTARVRVENILTARKR